MENTKIYKGRSGWSGETTYKNIGGWDWRISTMKRSNGRLMTIARAVKIKEENGFISTSFSMFSDPSITLIDEKVGRITEQAVKDQHYKALAIFDEKRENGELPTRTETEETVRRGMKIWFNAGYGSSDQLQLYVTEVTEGFSGGVGAKFVNADKLTFGSTDRLRPESEKFGIGYYYYEPEEYISEDKLNDLIIDVQEAQTARENKIQAEIDLANAKRKAELEVGTKGVKVPSWAKAVIVAQYWENHSDSMTDYFHASPDTDKTVYLAFSKTTRNNMPELRKAALKFEETEKWGTGKGKFYVVSEALNDSKTGDIWAGSYGSEWHRDKLKDDEGNRIEFSTKKEAEDFMKSLPEPHDIDFSGQGGEIVKFRWKIKEENLEQRRGGYNSPDFYVGEDSWSGWKVTKLKYTDIHSSDFKETLAVANAQGRYLIDTPFKSSGSSEVIASSGNFEIIAGKHTKYGTDIWTVKVLDRVDAETFAELRRKAKEEGGYYSSYRGNGAIPGFIFKTEEGAKRFSGSGSENSNIDIELLNLEAEAIKIKFKFSSDED
jgi:hypothetical protein